MCSGVYGIDPSKDLTPADVRDALRECFYEAHCENSELTGDKAADRTYCDSIVRKAFSETGGDVENPTKESLMSAMGYLQEFSQNFRNPKIIEKHAASIMKLLEKLS